MALRIAMRPVPALTTVAPLAGGLVLPPVLPASDGDGDPLLVVTAGDTVVGVLIVKKTDQLPERSNTKHVSGVLTASLC